MSCLLWNDLAQRSLRENIAEHRELFDCSRETSSWITFQCSTRTLFLIRRMSAQIQFTDGPKSENHPCTTTKCPSVTIVPGSYLSVGGRLWMRLNRPSRPGRS